MNLGRLTQVYGATERNVRSWLHVLTACESTVSPQLVEWVDDLVTLPKDRFLADILTAGNRNMLLSMKSILTSGGKFVIHSCIGHSDCPIENIRHVCKQRLIAYMHSTPRQMIMCVHVIIIPEDLNSGTPSVHRMSPACSGTEKNFPLPVCLLYHSPS